MFQSISLGNFKAFGPTQRIPIRPLTLIFGPNSAGKSSFIHGLLFAHEAHNSNAPNNLDVKRPRLGGDSVDLGGFRQFVHRRDLSNRVEWGVEINTSDLSGRLAELLAASKLVRLSVSIGQPEANDDIGPRVEAYEITIDSVLLLRASLKRANNEWQLRIDQLDGDHPIMRTTVKALIESMTTTETLQPADFEAELCSLDKLVREGISLKQGTLLPERVLFPISKGNRDEGLTSVARLELPRVIDELIHGLADFVGDRLKRLRYLGPLRSYPQRHWAFSEDHDRNWSAGGGYAWGLIREDQVLRLRVNQWLGGARMKTPYRLEVRDFYSADQLEAPFLQFLTETEERLIEEFEEESEEGVHQGVLPEDYYPSFTDNRQVHPTPRSVQVLPEDYYPSITDPDGEFDSFRKLLESSGANPIQDLVLVDVAKKTIVSHRDVGIGVSQVLPVLVSAFAADHECVAIEQPEIHLHPALQAELGDVFINAALGGKQNTFLLETHSEHLILRIMRRIRETTTGTLPEGCRPIRPEDVTVIYVEPSIDGSLAREMPLNELGVLVKAWPGGFFEEGLKEVF